jgi:hypothetical protein
MAWLGLFCLGAFIGYVTTFGLHKITDWAKPGNVLTAVISAAVAGAVFTFIQFLGGSSLGTALYLYPVGLAYGALCTNLRWVTEPNATRWVAVLHVLAFTAASVALVLLFVAKWFRDLLPPLP